jgi:hypothetical protein
MGADEPVVLELSRQEAARVLAALRQYEPYWTERSPLDPREQLARISAEITSLIWRLEVAMLLSEGSVG